MDGFLGTVRFEWRALILRSGSVACRRLHVGQLRDMHIMTNMGLNIRHIEIIYK